MTRDLTKKSTAIDNSTKGLEYDVYVTRYNLFVGYVNKSKILLIS